MKPAPRTHCLTLHSKNGLLRELITTCHISAVYDPDTTAPGDIPPLEEFKAIWDTGATNCAISQRVVDRCGLKPMGRAQVQTAAGVAPADVYLLHVKLPGDLGFTGVKATLCDFGGDVLIGMDLIAEGDFSITCQGGKTVFSFRYPSQHTVDFVAEHNNRDRRAAKTTSPGQSFMRNKGRRR